jgi:thiazole/oxazole-forming peptide maturase SagC family component
MIGSVGPLVVPGDTACYECLRARENANLADPQLARASEAGAFQRRAVTGFHPSMASVLGDLAAIELTKFFGGGLPTRVGRLIEVNLLATTLRTRKVLKVPRCQVCSPANRRSEISTDKNIFMPGHQYNE